jgi:hypothetical protein
MGTATYMAVKAKPIDAAKGVKAKAWHQYWPKSWLRLNEGGLLTCLMLCLRCTKSLAVPTASISQMA